MTQLRTTLVDALRDHPDFALLTPVWPSDSSFGGEFIQTRVRAYSRAGLQGTVIEYSHREAKALTAQEHDGFVHVRIDASQLGDAVLALAERDVPILAHSPSPTLQDLLVDNIPGRRLAIWYHGYEVRDYRRLHCNTLTKGHALVKQERDALNASRFAAARRVFSHPGATVVFVSKFQRDASQFDVGAKPERVEIIPNFIDGDFYRGRVRTPDEARAILLMRSFTARNYGNDIATRALSILSSRDGFSDLSISIIGFGGLFQSKVLPLRHLPNVTIREAYSRPIEMASHHYDHGIFLCPSRYDTHGVMLGEAMASGMVTITNPVAGIPEFTDRSCSVLARPDDPIAFAEALWHLVENPDLMPALSRNAMQRVRAQCSKEQTIDREISLITRLRNGDVK